MAKETNEISNEKIGTLGFIITLVCVAVTSVALGISQNWIAMALAIIIAGLISYIHCRYRSYAKLVMELDEKCNRLAQEQVKMEERVVDQVNDRMAALTTYIHQMEEVSANVFNDLNDRCEAKKEKHNHPTAKVVTIEPQAEPIIVNQEPTPHGNVRHKKKKSMAVSDIKSKIKNIPSQGGN